LARRIYDAATLNYITLFESLTGAKVKDCIIDEKFLIIVDKGDMGLAIGKQGANLKRVEAALKRKVRVVEFDENVSQFIRNYIYPIKVAEVRDEEGIIKIKGNDTKTKGMMIGRERTNLKRMTDIVKRFFNISEICVE